MLRLGEFHTVMCFLGVLGKRFASSGLEDVLIESETVASGSMKAVLSGSMVNRGIRAHKLLYESLLRLQIQDFLQETDYSENYEASIIHTKKLYTEQNVFDTTSCADFMQEFQLHITERCSKSATYQLWNSYLEMVSILLSFIRATRTSDWQLHLASLRQMLPHFFAYDRNNYAR